MRPEARLLTKRGWRDHFLLVPCLWVRGLGVNVFIAYRGRYNDLVILRRRHRSLPIVYPRRVLALGNGLLRRVGRTSKRSLERRRREEEECRRYCCGCAQSSHDGFLGGKPTHVSSRSRSAGDNVHRSWRLRPATHGRRPAIKALITVGAIWALARAYNVARGGSRRTRLWSAPATARSP